MPTNDQPLTHKPIRESRVILAEGADAYFFLIWAYQEFGAKGIEVRDFGGNEQLRIRLRTFVNTPRFDQVQSLVIARDAETDGDAAFRRVAAALRAANLPVPTQPFEFCAPDVGKPRTAVMIFPGFDADPLDSKHLAPGTLEDLCLGTLSKLDPILSCVDEYLECVRNQAKATPHPTKSRLHAYLAGRSEFAGLKLGEATKAKAWNLNHPSLAPFRRIIGEM